MDSRISILTLAVSDLEKSFDFYAKGLALLTTRKPEDGIIFFQTLGTCFALYPRDNMKEEMKTSLSFNKPGEIFGGIH